VHQMGGAMARIPAGSTAFGHRQSPFLLNIISMWAERGGEDQHVGWVRRFTEAMQPRSAGVYVNFLGDEGEQSIRASYDEGSYDRLVALKNTYDPTNLFRLNQNIKPTVAR